MTTRLVTVGHGTAVAGELSALPWAGIAYRWERDLGGTPPLPGSSSFPGAWR
jgi:hypothetical protein